MNGYVCISEVLLQIFEKGMKPWLVFKASAVSEKEP